jgi:hypothetical protein
MERKFLERRRKARAKYNREILAFPLALQNWMDLSPAEQKKKKKPEEPVAPYALKRSGKSLGHDDLDWLATLRSKQTKLGWQQSKKLREYREDHADSELRARRSGKSPTGRAPSKRKEIIKQFQYRQRDEKRYAPVYKETAKASPKKLATRDTRLARIAALEAEIAALKEIKNNPYYPRRKNFVGAALRAGATLLKTPMGRKIAAEVAIVGTMMVGEKLMSKGKVSPKVASYVQARVEAETGRKPTLSEVKRVMEGLDPNKDKTLTAAEVAKVMS